MTKREKKKNNKKNRLLLLILLLICTFIIVGTSTYAWFISNKTVSVDSLDVQARTSSGLQISASAEASDWASSIDKNDLISNAWDGNTNQLPSILDHVSSGGVIDTTTGKMNMYTGTVNTECSGTWDTDHKTCTGGDIYYTLTSAKANEVQCYDKNGTEENPDSTNKCGSTSTFVAFDIFLKYTGSSDAALYLGANSGVSKTETKSYGIENATRVAFVVEGNMTIDDYNTAVENKDLTTITGSKGATDDDVYIWEPNSNAHTASALNYASEYYGLTIAKDNARINYDGVISTFSDLNLKEQNTAAKNPTYFKSVTPDIVTTTSMSRTSTGITLKSGVTKIRVYFWVEGQDVDTENDATGHNMKLNLEFSIN